MRIGQGHIIFELNKYTNTKIEISRGKRKRMKGKKEKEKLFC